MRFNAIFTLVLGAILGAALVGIFNQTSVRAADDTRDQRMDKSNWTTGDYARDALDHLKKAQTEMHHVADAEGSKVAKDAAQMCDDARARVDAFVQELDAKKHK